MADHTECGPARLRCDWQENPLGTDNPAPRLSWALDDRRIGARQSAWQVQVSDAPDAFDEGRLAWDSGRVRGASSTAVRYEGAPLAQRTRYWWRLRVWDASGAVTAWSEPAFWETGLLGSYQGEARWIGLRQNAEDMCPVRSCAAALPSAAGCAARARVVSMPSWDVFEQQSQAYRDRVLPPAVTARVAIEQASTFGWERYIGTRGAAIGMHTFGASAPLKALQQEFGFDTANVVAVAKDVLRRR